jgi:hypothetical protein
MELIPWSRIIKKLTATQLVKTSRFFWNSLTLIRPTTFTRVWHWPLSWASWIQTASSYLIALRLVLIISFIPPLHRQCCYSSRRPLNILYTFRMCPIRATCSVYPTPDMITIIVFWWRVQIAKLFIVRFSASCYLFHVQMFS